MKGTIIKSILTIIAVAAIAGSATYSVWTASAQSSNNTFSTGTASLQITHRGQPWLTEIAPGMTFANIYPGWTQDYSIFVRNNGTTNLMLVLGGALHDSWTDSKNLRFVIKVHVWEFTDANANWLWDSGEDIQDYGEKTLEAMRHDVGTAFNLNQVNVGAVRGFLLRFSAPGTMDDAYQNAELTGFDFKFNGTTEGAIQPTVAPLP